MDDKRIAVVAIVVDEQDAVTDVNRVLHDYSSIIIGRMGIPYPNREISLISVAVDAPNDVISALSGRLGNLDGLSVKTVYSKLPNTKKEG